MEPSWVGAASKEPKSAAKKAGRFSPARAAMAASMVGLLGLVGLALLFSQLGRHRCHVVEPTEGLDKIKAGARQYYVHHRYDQQGNLLPKRFPNSTRLTPALGPNCDRGVTPSIQWQSRGWKQLQFAISEPHYYAFQFTSSGAGPNARFTARAYGDLDCDGEWSTFELRGSVDPEGVIKVVGPIITDEIE